MEGVKPMHHNTISRITKDKKEREHKKFNEVRYKPTSSSVSEQLPLIMENYKLRATN